MLRNSIRLYDHFVLSIAHGDKNFFVKSAKDEKYEISVNSFHKKICNVFFSSSFFILSLKHFKVTCIDVCEGYFVCGSRDCRISVYSIEKKKPLMIKMIKREIEFSF